MEKEILLGIPTPTARTDENGYLRYIKGNRLVHRKTCYDANKGTPPHYHVHHINGDKKDNRVENLIALPPKIHQELHKKFRMWALPNREEIVLFLRGRQITKGGRGKRKKNKKLKKKKGMPFRRAIEKDRIFQKEMRKKSTGKIWLPGSESEKYRSY